MTAAFRLLGLPYEPFADLFRLADDELARRGAVRRIATEPFGFPCRVGLQDAAPGDELLLLPFLHQPEASPYRASGPIFVRRDAVPARLAPGELPPYVTRRLISARAYDERHMIVDAEVCDGADAGALLQRFFARADVAYVHLHNAKRGCFSCRAVRAG